MAVEASNVLFELFVLPSGETLPSEQIFEEASLVVWRMWAHDSTMAAAETIGNTIQWLVGISHIPL